MNLYNQKGDCFPMAPEVWTRLLTQSMRGGWSPSGTLAPLESADGAMPPKAPEWSGCYYPAEGQQVSAWDARHLAGHLSPSSLLHLLGPEMAAEFFAFCLQGGFVVCPDPNDTAEIPLLNDYAIVRDPSGEAYVLLRQA